MGEAASAELLLVHAEAVPGSEEVVEQLLSQLGDDEVGLGFGRQVTHIHHLRSVTRPGTERSLQPIGDPHDTTR